MKKRESVVEALRRAFSADEVSRAPDASCPAPERIWDAAHAALETGERRAIVEHISRCPACAADWRVAMRSEGTGASEAAVAPAARWPRWAGLAAAAVLAAVALLVLDRAPAPETTPVFRAGEELEIRSLVPPDLPLDRDEAWLRWTPLGGDARYTVEVDTPGLRPLAGAADLEDCEYRIPREALEELASGETVVWRVEALLPDGRRVASKAFLAQVE